jgi:hypothetical protein
MFNDGGSNLTAIIIVQTLFIVISKMFVAYFFLQTYKVIV